MATPQVRQFAGDVRLWLWKPDGSRVPVIPVDFADDSSGNQPMEIDTLTFSYAKGEETKVLSKRRDSHYQQPINVSTLPGPTSAKITALECPPIMLARVLFGEL